MYKLFRCAVLAVCLLAAVVFTTETSNANIEEETPSGEEVASALHHAQTEERAREDQLESPPLVRAREHSRTAYVLRDSGIEAGELLRATFASELATLNLDPARFLSDSIIEQRLGRTGARVTKDGETSLLESAAPVVTRDEQGQLKTVDLSLEPGGKGFRASNPLVISKSPTPYKTALASLPI
jgi:hypothetical protein